MGWGGGGGERGTGSKARCPVSAGCTMSHGQRQQPLRRPADAFWQLVGETLPHGSPREAGRRDFSCLCYFCILCAISQSHHSQSQILRPVWGASFKGRNGKRIRNPLHLVAQPRGGRLSPTGAGRLLSGEAGGVSPPTRVEAGRVAEGLGGRGCAGATRWASTRTLYRLPCEQLTCRN